MRLALVGVVLELLDALTTFLIVTMGRGYEANPRLFFVNEEPMWLFPIFLAQAAFVGGVGYLAWLEKRRGFMYAYYMTAMPLIGYLVHKAVVVVNNVAVGVFGYGGLDYYMSEAIKTLMMLGGFAYGVVKMKSFFNN
jgi:hypothetical protein